MYKRQRLYWARGSPCSAACLYQYTAWCYGNGSGTPKNPRKMCIRDRAVTMSAPDRAYNLAELTALPLEDMAGELERLTTPPSLAAA